ncbi:MAG: VOC family protein, partial [Vicinamibacterales bacterium]
LGWTPGKDEGSQNQCRIGDVGDVIIRRNTRIGAPAPAMRHASIGHISFGIAPWDLDQVKAELDKRGLNARPDSGLCKDIHTSPYQSYHTTTPNGFDLQISNATLERRDAAAQCS